MKLSAAGVDFIAQWEGFSATAYNDPAGNCTVGYGELLHLGVCTDAELALPPMTEEEAKAGLADKAAEYADCMKRSTAVPLNQNQYDALTSFTYNLGCGGYINSSVRVAVEHGTDVRDALMQYIHGSDGVEYAGLINRRRAEGQLFYHEEDGLTQAQYDELKTALDADIGAVLKQLGDLGEKTDQLIKKADNLAAIAWRDATRLNALEAK